MSSSLIKISGTDPFTFGMILPHLDSFTVRRDFSGSREEREEDEGKKNSTSHPSRPSRDIFVGGERNLPKAKARRAGQGGRERES